ncbi:CRISPR-associated Csx4 family protein [Plasticicumulans lactativorans]|uniref:CRISPR-associated Csx4 family protein n=1 Tax=Plasticicumulans lactativorans TaxID=1133106 RepID=A0A4R2L826_9GAMM|nr:type I-U CRISPR-associated RAMP protein Csb1/Cas7u [Plasticicumulans lactativorans]TCO78838.1 CRISPR-associated Csx4 family protein [Plasticicumulans lactativorans]
MTSDVSPTLETLRQAVRGGAAIRLRQRLAPAGGPGSKVFPPTHEGGQYAWETRRVAGQELRCVLLDSVQSQANRMELALLDALRAGRLALPLVEARFAGFPDIGAVSTLEAPHRIADAIFRDATLDGVPFRDSVVGRAFIEATIRDAGGLYRWCPTALVFGMWDSTALAQGAGLGTKFQRCIASEIVGFGAVPGVLTKSRRDPLETNKAAVVYAAHGGTDWTAFPNEADKDKSGEAVLFRRKDGAAAEAGKPSAINHSSVPPSFHTADKAYLTVAVGEPVRGGVTVDYAELCAVLSLPGLRRLRFPRPDGSADAARNEAARSVLAALALAALALQREQGYDLRSRCLLIPEGAAGYELIAADGSATALRLDADAACALLAAAVAAAAGHGLEWPQAPVVLEPEPKLLELVRRSRAATGAESAE